MRAEQPCGRCSFTAVGRSVPWPGKSLIVNGRLSTGGTSFTVGNCVTIDIVGGHRRFAEIEMQTAAALGYPPHSRRMWLRLR